MSTKSYTLADGTTATVNATDNGVPFNEGMNVLSKAIKAKINTSSGSGTGGASGKLVPTLRRDGWVYTVPESLSSIGYEGGFTYEYNGDGVVFCFLDVSWEGSSIDTMQYSPKTFYGIDRKNKVIYYGGSFVPNISQRIELYATEGEQYQAAYFVDDYKD